MNMAGINRGCVEFMKRSLTFITLGVVSTPMAGKPGIIDAQVVDYGPKSGRITIGDRVEGFIAIKNTGRVPIEKVTIHINLEKDLPVTGMTSLFKGDFQERMNIEPGDTKTYKRARRDPGTVHGSAVIRQLSHQPEPADRGFRVLQDRRNYSDRPKRNEIAFRLY